MVELGGASGGAGGALRGGSELGTSRDPALSGRGEAIGTGGGGALSGEAGRDRDPSGWAVRVWGELGTHRGLAWAGLCVADPGQTGAGLCASGRGGSGPAGAGLSVAGLGPAGAGLWVAGRGGSGSAGAGLGVAGLGQAGAGLCVAGRRGSGRARAGLRVKGRAQGPLCGAGQGLGGSRAVAGSRKQPRPQLRRHGGC